MDEYMETSLRQLKQELEMIAQLIEDGSYETAHDLAQTTAGVLEELANGGGDQ